MVDMNTVVNEIRNMTSDELNNVIAEIKLRRNYIANKTARGLSKDDTVQFTGRRGETIVGRVTKINTKTVIVRELNSPTTWKVTASMLSRKT
jgi:hypothetical protein